MVTLSTPTVFSGSEARNSFTLADSTLYQGGITVTGGSGIDTIFLPHGVVTALFNGNESAGVSSIDLSSAAGASVIQPGLGEYTLDSSGLVIGGQVEIMGSYSLAIVNPELIENLVGSNAVDILRGNALGNVIYGGDYRDMIYGMEGNDELYGGIGVADPNDEADLLAGGTGNDTICGNAGNDTIYGGNGEADSTDGDDIVYAGKGADWVYGNSGNDTIYGGGAGYDPLDQGDLIYGGGGDDFIFGNGGNDTLEGGAGNDTMYGGFGTDIYVIRGGGGNDVIAQFDNPRAFGGDVLQIASGINGTDIYDTVFIFAHMIYGDGSVTIDLGGGHSVTVLGVSALGSDDFQII